MDPDEFSHGPGRSDSQEGRPEDPQPPAGAEEASPEPIMSRLPKSRPKRQSPVRARAAQEVERKAGKAPGSRPAPGRAAPAPSRAASPTARPHANGGDPAVFGPTEHAPGLPQLALDGAIEAVKLPIKVGANLTFRALDAVTKSLRRR